MSSVETSAIVGLFPLDVYPSAAWRSSNPRELGVIIQIKDGRFTGITLFQQQTHGIQLELFGVFTLSTPVKL